MTLGPGAPDMGLIIGHGLCFLLKDQDVQEEREFSGAFSLRWLKKGAGTEVPALPSLLPPSTLGAASPRPGAPDLRQGVALTLGTHPPSTGSRESAAMLGLPEF